MVAPIHPATTLGAVCLTVADLDGAQRFYEQVLGLRTLERSGDTARLGAGDGPALVELAGRPGAPPRPARTTGLFHLALLVPTRAELARSLHRVAEGGWSFSGASDHLVSEALYLRDPEGNGIEIYRDRPRAEWPHAGGELRMSTESLDLEGLTAELPAGRGEGGDGVAAGTRIGHVHLQVSDLDAAEGFYHRLLGLDVTVRSYPGALFLSAGGYHHHVGLNTWAGTGAPAPPPGSRGLRRFQLLLPDEDELAGIEERLRGAALDVEPTERGLVARDPSGNAVLLGAAPRPPAR